MLDRGEFPDAPAEGKCERWWLARMILRCGGDRVVFTLAKLRWIAQLTTAAAVEIFW